MGVKYIVELTVSEREYLQRIINVGKTQGYRIRHAQIILALDKGETKESWSYEEISRAYRVNESTITQIAKRFVNEGLEAALGRKEQENRHRKIDGEVEARIVATACSEPPEGQERWTLQLIADEIVRLEVVESISATAIGTTLKKTNLSHGKRRNGVFRNPARSL